MAACVLLFLMAMTLPSELFSTCQTSGMGRKSTRGRCFCRCDGAEMQQVFPDRLLKVCRRV